MWIYEKKLEYPIKIKTPNPQMAKVIITQREVIFQRFGEALRIVQDFLDSKRIHPVMAPPNLGM